MAKTNWSKMWEPESEKEQPFIFRCSCDWLNVAILLSRDAGIVGNYLQYLRGVKKTNNVSFTAEQFREWALPQRMPTNLLKRGLTQLHEMGLIQVAKMEGSKSLWCVDINELPKYSRKYPWNAIKTKKVS